MKMKRVNELILKMLDSSYVFNHTVKRIKWLISHTPGEPSTQKRYFNIVFDVLLGLVFYIVVLKQMDAQEVTSSFMMAAEAMKNTLEQLLQWLMGAPAGLKLNQELSYFLGNFFTFHVDLWMAYLRIVKTILPEVMALIGYSCCLGISLFFCFLNDVMNVLTLHIVCFYVYAAKLYYFQLKALVSLTRLFTGKKWNVLRLRVDSITYQADQLILGTILFTILLFLLPTTLVYYVVFTGTRLLILLMQTLFSIVVVILDDLPIYPLYQTFVCNNMQPSLKTDKFEIKYKIKINGDDVINRAECVHTVNYQRLTFADIFINAIRFEIPDVKTFFGNLLTGVIIKPWECS